MKAQYRLEGDHYRKVFGGPEYPDTTPASMFFAHVEIMGTPKQAAPAHRSTTPAAPAPAPTPTPVRHTWESYTGPELDKIARERPALFAAMLAHRRFRRELGMLGMSDAEIVCALNRRAKRDPQAAQLRERLLKLREALD